MKKKLIDRVKNIIYILFKYSLVALLMFVLLYLSYGGRLSFKVKDFNSYCEQLQGTNRGYFMYESLNLEKTRLIIKNEWLRIVQDGNLDFLRHTLFKDFSELKFNEVAKTLITPDEYGDSDIDVKEEKIDGKLFIIFRFYGMGDMPRDNINNMFNQYKKYIDKAKAVDIKYFDNPYTFCLYRGIYDFYDGLFIETMDPFGRGLNEKIYFK